VHRGHRRDRAQSSPSRRSARFLGARRQGLDRHPAEPRTRHGDDADMRIRRAHWLQPTAASGLFSFFIPFFFFFSFFFFFFFSLFSSFLFFFFFFFFFFSIFFLFFLFLRSSVMPATADSARLVASASRRCVDVTTALIRSGTVARRRRGDGPLNENLVRPRGRRSSGCLGPTARGSRRS